MGNSLPRSGLNDEEMEAEDEDLGHAETYAEYMPSKCKPASMHRNLFGKWGTIF